MGGLAEERVRARRRGLVERDPTLIERVLDGDEPINQLHIEIDNRCFKLLALHQPMAADLRAIVAAVKINTDLERVGDLAVNIAEAARALHAAPAGQEADRHPADGDDRAGDAARRARRLRPPRHRRWPSTSSNEDDELDALKTQIFRELLTYMLQDPSTIEPALDLILISRHLERIGDHATNIAEDVIFMVSAQRRPPPRRRSRLATAHELGSCSRSASRPREASTTIEWPVWAHAAAVRRSAGAQSGRSGAGGRSAASAAGLQDLARWADGGYRVPGERRIRRHDDDASDEIRRRQT